MSSIKDLIHLIASLGLKYHRPISKGQMSWNFALIYEPYKLQTFLISRVNYCLVISYVKNDNFFSVWLKFCGLLGMGTSSDPYLKLSIKSLSSTTVRSSSFLTKVTSGLIFQSRVSSKSLFALERQRFHVCGFSRRT